MADEANEAGGSPSGTQILRGKDGPQIIDSTGERWNDEVEKKFFDHLAASCNVTASAKAVGFSDRAIYYRRRKYPDFARKWQAALEQGAARIEMLLVQRATEALEGFTPDPDTPIPEMTVRDALAILGHHRDAVKNGTRSRRNWARPKSLDEMSDEILARLEAIAPSLSSASFETGLRDAGCAGSSAPPQDERGACQTAHPEE